MIIGFEINKINVDRKGDITGGIRVKQNFNINSVKEQEIKILKEKKKGIAFEFVFSVDYGQAVGNISMNGNLMYTDNDKKVKEVIESWKKDKKIPHEVSVEILNVILSRCNIKALELAEDAGLPPHIPLPRVSGEKNKFSEYIG